MNLRRSVQPSRDFFLALIACVIIFGLVIGVLRIISMNEERAVLATSARGERSHTALLARLQAEDSGKSATNESTPSNILTRPGATAPSKVRSANHGIQAPANCNKGGPHADTDNLIAIIVNKKHCLKPIDFVPALQTVSCAGSGSATLSPIAVTAFKELCAAAKNAGVPLGITSSYRSYETQVSTYSYWVSVSGPAGADRYSARPGYSEHQTGLSVDFSASEGSLDGFTGTPQQKWMAANAWKYGFIQRYTAQNSALTGYNAESWHYRYVGTAVASQIHSLGPSASLESLWGVPGGDYQ